jgi:hypothetical protein
MSQLEENLGNSNNLLPLFMHMIACVYLFIVATVMETIQFSLLLSCHVAVMFRFRINSGIPNLVDTRYDILDGVLLVHYKASTVIGQHKKKC